jgi:hypothetical protein
MAFDVYDGRVHCLAMRRSTMLSEIPGLPDPNIQKAFHLRSGLSYGEMRGVQVNWLAFISSLLPYL